MSAGKNFNPQEYEPCNHVQACKKWSAKWGTLTLQKNLFV